MGRRPRRRSRDRRMRGAPLSEAGCPNGQVCAGLRVSGELASFGSCRPGCSYDSGAACSDPAQTCVAGELLAWAWDTCLDLTPVAIGRSCSFPLQDGDPCGETALCMAGRCTDVCRYAVGGVGTTGHRDCVDPNATCTTLEPGLLYGVCRP